MSVSEHEEPEAVQRHLNLTDQENLRLVREVEKRPLLYNTRLQTYSRKPDTDKAWNEIGEATNLSGALCKERWKNIRVVLSRYLKAKPGTRKKPYYLADATKFLLPYMNSPYLSQQRVDGASTTTTETTAANLTNFDILRSQLRANTTMPTTSTSQTVTTPKPSADQQASSSKMKPSTKYDMEIKVEPVENFESSEHSLDSDLETYHIDIKDEALLRESDMSDSSEEGKAIPRTPNDPVLSFLDSIAPELKEMTFEQFKIFKRKCFVLIDEVTSSTSNH